MSQQIKMVDLFRQYEKIKEEVDVAISDVIRHSSFINGAVVTEFAKALSKYLNIKYIIPCANGTDALQIAYMTLALSPGDEVIMPPFNYVASAEAACLLGLKPVFIDVYEDSFLINEDLIESKITERTKAIVPVHLFGQTANMESITRIARKYGLWIIEDNAQALGSEFVYTDGTKSKSGTIGHINTTSFFPSKNLGCFGDGGAIMTNDPELAEKAQILTRHGQKEKYSYQMIGCNSRLDSIQAAILKVKLKYFDDFIAQRQKAATTYNELLKPVLGELTLPKTNKNTTHVFHQYVIKLDQSKRNEVKESLYRAGIPSLVYYPFPLHLQKAFKFLGNKPGDFPVSEQLCKEVLALPMHTELSVMEQKQITTALIEALKNE